MSYTGTLFFSPSIFAPSPPYVLADKDQSHVIGGLKAAISNPNTSTEAKEHAAERLQELDQEPLHHELGSHQIAGYKATISSSWHPL